MNASAQPLPRQLRLYRPYPEAVPWALFERAGLDDGQLDQLAAWVSQALTDPPSMHLRVARYNDETQAEEETIAVYFLEQTEGFEFSLRFLLVAERWRRRGVGRWVTGHALGIAEAKGGRALRVQGCTALSRFLIAYGFERQPCGELRYRFSPE